MFPRDIGFYPLAFMVIKHRVIEMSTVIGLITFNVYGVISKRCAICKEKIHMHDRVKLCRRINELLCVFSSRNTVKSQKLSSHLILLSLSDDPKDCLKLKVIHRTHGIEQYCIDLDDTSSCITVMYPLGIACGK